MLDFKARRGRDCRKRTTPSSKTLDERLLCFFDSGFRHVGSGTVQCLRDVKEFVKKWRLIVGLSPGRVCVVCHGELGGRRVKLKSVYHG